MKTPIHQNTPRTRRSLAFASLVLAACFPSNAHASFLSGDALDTLANILSWIVLVVAPITVIGIFLLIHILPEKIAEKKHHPQAKAIQCLCILSLFFGGLLWPLAWLWAYTKPVFHKMAYGTDVSDEAGHGKPDDGSRERKAKEDEAAHLRARIAQLEKKLAGVAASLGGDA